MKAFVFVVFILVIFLEPMIEFDTLEEAKKDKFELDTLIIMDAIALYMTTNGTGVPSLSDLVPQYLAKMPECPYHGEYRIITSKSGFEVLCESSE
ncbi:hypothetical protein [Pseudoalteromonas ardens]|uniref:Type II secretion system protein GspG C-terminal domain-containing protein n=1 Tax=Pseudoalteromonas rubra TaxID=43658 RepID=A0A0L0ET08_9GAMM|nr:hypothetical protein [Pseudoalteromonas sp. R96]KNC67602.1 hypothetical protein AC626_09665 [Pseudoalteromonas rubra]MDK1314253.1 hypothetical protein [Pseudoalteromonas sp. R96]